MTTRHKTRVPGVYFRLTSTGERRYQISYRDSNGKRIFKTVNGNEQDARHARNEILSRIRKGDRVVSSRLTMKELAEDYLRTQTSHLRPSTVGAYGYSLDKWVTPWFGHRKVSDVGVDDIADFIAEMRQTLSGGTIRTCITPLSRMFQYAVRRGWAPQNPVSALDRMERPKGSPQQMRVLTTEEISQVLREASRRWRPLFATAIFTGLRISELLNLKWEDVDFDKSILKVRESKTAAGVREVVLPAFLVQQLAGLNGSEGFVFTTLEGRKLQARNVNRTLTKTLKGAGVGHARFHDLRHTFASILISNGENVVFLAEQMGHSNPSITLRLYAKLFDSVKSKDEARKRMDENFSGVMA